MLDGHRCKVVRFKYIPTYKPLIEKTLKKGILHLSGNSSDHDNVLVVLKMDESGGTFDSYRMMGIQVKKSSKPVIF